MQIFYRTILNNFYQHLEKNLIYEPTGLLSLHLECQNNATGVAVTESSCPEKQPIIPVSEECEIGVCPETFKWEITYAGCSVSCGGGELYVFIISFYVKLLF